MGSTSSGRRWIAGGSLWLPERGSVRLYINWAAPRKLVHLKWNSLGKLEPGGTCEQETDRRRSDPIVEGRRPRPGQGTDRLRLLPQGRSRPDDLPSLAQAA